MLLPREARIPHQAAVPHVVSGQRPPRLLLLIGVVACAPIAGLFIVLVGHGTWVSPGLFALAVGPALGLLVAIAAARRVARIVASLDRQRNGLYAELRLLGKRTAVGDIAFGIVHDLNNPLATIGQEAGWMQDLLCRSTLDEASTRGECVTSLSAIASQVARSSEITGRILRWARQQDDRTTGDGVDVNDAITRTLGLLERDLQAAHVRVVKRLASGLPTVPADGGDIGQVFLHLVKNALDAMKGTGGTLTVSTGRAGTMIHAQVSDTGPGIAPEVLGRIFEPHVSTKSGDEGSGLGLAISAWIVEQAGGRIEVYTGGGATFRVVLPAAAPGQRSGGSHARRSSAAGR